MTHFGGPGTSYAYKLVFSLTKVEGGRPSEVVPAHWLSRRAMLGAVDSGVDRSGESLPPTYVLVYAVITLHENLKAIGGLPETFPLWLTLSNALFSRNLPLMQDDQSSDVTVRSSGTSLTGQFQSCNTRSCCDT